MAEKINLQVQLQSKLDLAKKDLGKLKDNKAFSGTGGEKTLNTLVGMIQRLEAVDLKKLKGTELTNFLNQLDKIRGMLDRSSRSLTNYTETFKKQQQVYDDAVKSLSAKKSNKTAALQTKKEALSRVKIGNNTFYNKDTGRQITDIDTIVKVLQQGFLEIRDSKGEKALDVDKQNKVLETSGIKAYSESSKAYEVAKQEVTAQEVVVKGEKEKLDKLPTGSGVHPVTKEIQEHSAETLQSTSEIREQVDSETEENIKQTTEQINQQSVAIQKQSSSLGRAFKQFTLYHTIVRVTKTALKEAVQTVKELDKYLTEQAMVTGMTREQTYGLVKEYQNLALQCGATTKEIAQVSTEYMKQGKTVQESLILTEAAVSAAKVARVSVGDSVNYLTTALNGFQLSAEDAMKVSDKFAAVAASSATDYDELAIALSKVASQANLAGMSIDYTTALLTKGLETTREAPETMGTALKTIIARMRELSDYGETLEGDTDINNVESQLAYVGIALRDTNGELRSTEDVLDELGKKWDTLNKNQQAALAKALAGTRQQSRLIALMDGYERVTELQEISQRSAGATAAQAGVYLEGMEAAMNKIQVAWEKLVMNLTDSEFIIKTFNALGFILDGVGEVLGHTAAQVPLFTALAVAGSAMLGNKLREHDLAQRMEKIELRRKILQQEAYIKSQEQNIEQSLANLAEDQANRKRLAQEAQLAAEAELNNKIKEEGLAQEKLLTAEKELQAAQEKQDKADILAADKQKTAEAQAQHTVELQKLKTILLEKKAKEGLNEEEKQQLKDLNKDIKKSKKQEKTTADEAKAAKKTATAYKGHVTSAKKKVDLAKKELDTAKKNTKEAEKVLKEKKEYTKSLDEIFKKEEEAAIAKKEQEEADLQVERDKLDLLKEQAGSVLGLIVLFNNLKGVLLLFKPIYAGVLFLQKLINKKKNEEYVQTLRQQALEAKGFKKKLLNAAAAMAESAGKIPYVGWIIAAAILLSVGVGIAVGAIANYSKSAEKAAGDVNKLSDQIYKLNEQANAIDNITNSFDKLDNKLIKTKADLEEMNSLLEKAAESMDSSEVDKKDDVGFGKGKNEKEAYLAMSDDEKRLYLDRKQKAIQADLVAKRAEQKSIIANMNSAERQRLFDESSTDADIIRAQAAIYALNNAELYKNVDNLKNLEEFKDLSQDALSSVESLGQAMLENLSVSDAWEFTENPQKINTLTKTLAGLTTQAKNLNGELKEFATAEVLNSEDFALKDRIEAYTEIKNSLENLGPAYKEALEGFELEYSGFDIFAEMSDDVLNFIDSVDLSVDEINELWGAWETLQKQGIKISQEEWESNFDEYLEKLAETQGNVLVATQEIFGEYLDGSEETLNAFISAYSDLVSIGILNMGQNIDKFKNSINNFYEKSLKWNEMNESDKAEFIQDNADLFSDNPDTEKNEGQELLKAFQSGDYKEIERALSENESLQKQLEQRRKEVAQELLIEEGRKGEDRNEAYIAQLKAYEKYLNNVENLFKASLEVRLEQEKEQLDEYRSYLEEQQEALEDSLNKRKEAYEKYFDSVEEQEADEDYEEQADLLINNLSKISSTSNASAQQQTKELEQQLKKLEEERLKELRERAQEQILSNMDDELSEISEKFDKLLENSQALLLAMQGDLENPSEFLTDMLSNKIKEGATALEMEDYVNSLQTNFGSILGDSVDWEVLKEEIHQLFLTVNGQTINLNEEEQQSIYDAVNNAMIKVGKR